MSIFLKTDQQLRERIVRTDDRADLENLASEVGRRSLCSVAIFIIPGGVRVHAINGSGRTEIDEECPLPQDDDDLWTIQAKLRRIRTIKERMRKLMNNGTRPAA